MKKLIGRLVFCTLMVVLAAFGEDYRVFKSSDGREIVARIIEHDADAGKVHLELKNGKKGWMPLDLISAEDQAYAHQWCERNRFLDPTQLSIEVSVKDSGWKHDYYSGGEQDLGDDRDMRYRWTQYFVALSNHGDTG
jgi:hypothetical protein